MPHRKRPGLRHVALALAATVILAACGSSSGNTITPLKTTPTTAGTPTTTSVAPTTTSSTGLTGDAAIFAVVQNELQTYSAIASGNPINVADPRMAQYAAGKQLVNLRAALNQFYFHRQHVVGTTKGDQYRVLQRTAVAVLVLSCDFDTSAVVDNTTGQVVQPPANRSALINTELDLINGQWMVTDAGQRSPTC